MQGGHRNSVSQESACRLTTIFISQLSALDICPQIAPEECRLHDALHMILCLYSVLQRFLVLEESDSRKVIDVTTRFLGPSLFTQTLCCTAARQLLLYYLSTWGPAKFTRHRQNGNAHYYPVHIAEQQCQCCGQNNLLHCLTIVDLVLWLSCISTFKLDSLLVQEISILLMTA